MKTEITREALIRVAKAACDTLMRKYPAKELPPKGRFHYHQGVFLSGVYQTYLRCGDEKYYDYMKAYVDALVDVYGNVSGFNPGQLDDLQPGILLFPVLKRTGGKQYRTVLDTIGYYLKTFPKNSIGGWWHKAWYQRQMWLDGLYMGGPLSVEYGLTFDCPELVDNAIRQAQLMRQVTRDDKTGLWYHAWDENKAQPWADPETGRSPEFWGRSIGWVPVALLEEYELLPEDHPGRKILADISVDLLKALLPWQSAENGLWYQVVDKADQPDNWPEISCSCLYVCALCKAVRLGLMDKAVLENARKGCAAVLESVGVDENGLLIGGVCVGTGVGNYQHYVARPVSTNDLHGVGAFLLMCAEAADTL
ncbi:MAG: glycoside hydrolase family 88 protein [Clostridia bacterium]|nr:glycoside hydrolase family 88 protein [Clostridia bacterium]